MKITLAYAALTLALVTCDKPSQDLTQNQTKVQIDRLRPTSSPAPRSTIMPLSTPKPLQTPKITPSPAPSLTPIPQPTPTYTTTPTPTSTAAVPTPQSTPQSTKWSAPNDYPPSTWTPYSISPNSVWNTAFKDSAPQADPNSASYTSFYSSHYNFLTQAISFGYKSETNQYQHPIYFSYAQDPSYKIKCLASWAQQTCPTQSFHIPSYAQPAGGSDAHITSIDYTMTTPTELDCWSTNPLSGTGGTLTAQACGAGPLNGDGLGFGQTGAGFAQWAGVIRAQELISGNIQHALFMVTPCTNNNSVYPSISRTSDSFCSQGAPYGARLRLNLTPAQINSLSVPDYHKTILTALSLYGAYQGDNNNTGINLQTEADNMYSLAGVPNPLIAWAKANSVPFDGTAYRIDISKDVPLTSWQWLLPPKG